MKYRLKVAAAVLISLGASHARATGIPVIDVANLFQAVQQVINDITQINNQIQQIRQLQTQIETLRSENACNMAAVACRAITVASV